MIQLNLSASIAKERRINETNLSAKQRQKKKNARVLESDGDAGRTQGAETTPGQGP
jgi:hypothetical protein